MSEAEQLPVEEPQAAEPVVEASDPVEAQAREHGWVSQEEWEANPDNKGKVWRSAREFVERGEMIGEIRSVKAQMESLRNTMRETMDQQAKAIRKQLEDKYRKDFETAVDEGDKAKAAKAAEELANLKDQPVEDGAAKAVESFKTRNKWFNESATDPVDREMTDLAMAFDIALHRQGMGDTAERLAEVEKRIQKAFPEKFGNPNRSRAPTVETSGRVGRPSKKTLPSLDSLGPDFQNVGRKMVRQGVFKSEAEYVQSLVDAGALDV